MTENSEVLLAGMVSLKGKSLPPETLGDLMDRYRIRRKDDKADEWFYLYRYDEETDTLLLPKSALELLNRPVRDLRTWGRELEPFRAESRFMPRSGQAECIARMMEYLERNEGGLLIAGCGTGKTIMGAELILRKGVSACILVHKEFLADQWEEAFKMLAPEIRVGRCQRERCDTGYEYDVVIAMAQSITNANREYSIDFYRSFGVLVCDEVHRYGAQVWQDAIMKFHAYWRLGLTATPSRYDGLWPVIVENIGQIGSELIDSGLKPRIFVVKTSVTLSKRDYIQPWNGEVNRGKMTSAISEIEGRNEIIGRNILKAYKAGRKCLVISERRNQLEWLAKYVQAQGVDEEHVGFFVGGKKKDQLEHAAEKPVIFTTYQMTKEGLDIDTLDALIMATPQVSIQQTIGRVLRKVEGKAQPVVVDFADVEVEPLKGYMYARLKQYRKLGYEIHS